MSCLVSSSPLFARFFGTAAIVLLAACGKSLPPPEPPRPVLTAVLGEFAGGDEAVYSGEVRSRHETQLGFRIPGKIVERLVDAGAAVRPGQVLARLDPSDSALSAVSANAQLALAEAEAKRYRELRGRNFVSQAALDGKEAALTAARSLADLARNQSAYTVLKADQAGVIGLVAAEAGQVVTAGQTVFRVARADTLEVAISIPESRMPEMRVGGVAEVFLWADERARYKGVLRELSPVADPATRTFAARVAVVTPDVPDAKLLLGMTANVRFPCNGGEPRLTVPLAAIYQQDGKPALWIVDAGHAVSLRPVAIASYGEKFAVLNGGAKAGERIVVAGVHKLNAGETVKIAGRASAK
ncbi:MAG: efflux RND transporter periplasmic adaptor subunit [Betaproteobacteria bacterium]|nr:efflux RND transporter periplasmic adaptor subunit [Betaproteobacteria bacterium]